MTGGTVVVLGPTGRNVAAGMSGGTAYVLDLDRARVNPSALAVGEVELASLTDEDAERLLGLVRLHQEETESAVAAELLRDWPVAVQRFTKVLPREFRRVLEIREAALHEGLDPDSNEVFTRITEASHG
jgi:glutamate synthase (NADPH/NADH) large chain